MPELPASSESTVRPWRASAARLVEELFPATPADSWDDLLDLRGQLLHGGDWSVALEVFLTCRRRLEEDHYLPFYRLRRLLSAHLRLENADESGSDSLARLLRNRRKPRLAGGRSLRLVEQF